jgi:hypothetical protein
LLVWSVHLEVSENENMTYQKLWDTAKAVLGGMFIVMSAYIKGTERSNEIETKKYKESMKQKADSLKK